MAYQPLVEQSPRRGSSGHGPPSRKADLARGASLAPADNTYEEQQQRLAPADATAPGMTSDPVIVLETRPATVRNIQERLQHFGFDPGPVDGLMGPNTRKATVAFQRDRGLMVDGVVGPQTAGALQLEVQGPRGYGGGGGAAGHGGGGGAAGGGARAGGGDPGGGRLVDPGGPPPTGGGHVADDEGVRTPENKRELGTDKGSIEDNGKTKTLKISGEAIGGVGYDGGGNLFKGLYGAFNFGLKPEGSASIGEETGGNLKLVLGFDGRAGLGAVAAGGGKIATEGGVGAQLKAEASVNVGARHHASEGWIVDGASGGLDVSAGPYALVSVGGATAKVEFPAAKYEQLVRWGVARYAKGKWEGFYCEMGPGWDKLKADFEAAVNDPELAFNNAVDKTFIGKDEQERKEEDDKEFAKAMKSDGAFHAWWKKKAAYLKQEGFTRPQLEQVHTEYWKAHMLKSPQGGFKSREAQDAAHRAAQTHLGNAEKLIALFRKQNGMDAHIDEHMERAKKAMEAIVAPGRQAMMSAKMAAQGIGNHVDQSLKQRPSAEVQAQHHQAWQAWHKATEMEKRFQAHGQHSTEEATAKAALGHSVAGIYNTAKTEWDKANLLWQSGA